MECRFFDDWIRNIDNEMDKFSASLIYFLWMFIDITSDTKSNWANIFRKIWQIFKDNVCALNLALRFFIVYFFSIQVCNAESTSCGGVYELKKHYISSLNYWKGERIKVVLRRWKVEQDSLVLSLSCYVEEVICNDWGLKQFKLLWPFVKPNLCFYDKTEGKEIDNKFIRNWTKG